MQQEMSYRQGNKKERESLRVSEFLSCVNDLFIPIGYNG